MIFKRFLTTICLAATLAVSVPSAPAFAKHAVTDASQNAQMMLDLVQMMMALKEEIEMVTQLTDMNATIGDLKKKGGDLFGGMVNGAKDEAASFAKSTVSTDLQGIGFESAMDKASSMQSLVDSKLLTKATDKLTDSEALERLKMRKSVAKNAATDAYSNAVAYLSESTKANEEKIEPAKQTVGSKETTKDKQDGANEVAVARLKEQIQGNRLMAELLKLKAADALGSMPKFDVES